MRKVRDHGGKRERREKDREHRQPARDPEQLRRERITSLVAEERNLRDQGTAPLCFHAVFTDNSDGRIVHQGGWESCLSLAKFAELLHLRELRPGQSVHVSAWWTEGNFAGYRFVTQHAVLKSPINVPHVPPDFEPVPLRRGWKTFVRLHPDWPGDQALAWPEEFIEFGIRKTSTPQEVALPRAA